MPSIIKAHLNFVDACKKKGVEDEENIKRAHQTISKSNKNQQRKPRTIVANLHKYNNKIKIPRNASNLKDKNIITSENFSLQTLNYR